MITSIRDIVNSCIFHKLYLSFCHYVYCISAMLNSFNYDSVCCCLFFTIDLILFCIMYFKIKIMLVCKLTQKLAKLMYSLYSTENWLLWEGVIFENISPPHTHTHTKFGSGVMRPSQGFWGTGEQGQFFQGNKGLKIRGTGEHRQFWETGNIENQVFFFFGTRPFFRGNKGTGTPPSPPLGRASVI